MGIPHLSVVIALFISLTVPGDIHVLILRVTGPTSRTNNCLSPKEFTWKTSPNSETRIGIEPKKGKNEKNIDNESTATPTHLEEYTGKEKAWSCLPYRNHFLTLVDTHTPNHH